MSMIDGLRNVLGINQDPEADSYVDDNEEDDIFPGGGQGGSPAPEEAYPCLLYTSPSPRDRG